MFARSVLRPFSSDFAHKQVTNGFSKKYGENFDKIFGKKPSTSSKPKTVEPNSSKPQTEKK